MKIRRKEKINEIDIKILKEIYKECDKVEEESRVRVEIMKGEGKDF